MKKRRFQHRNFHQPWTILSSHQAKIHLAYSTSKYRSNLAVQSIVDRQIQTMRRLNKLWSSWRHHSGTFLNRGIKKYRRPNIQYLLRRSTYSQLCLCLTEGRTSPCSICKLYFSHSTISKELTNNTWLQLSLKAKTGCSTRSIILGSGKLNPQTLFSR